MNTEQRLGKLERSLALWRVLTLVLAAVLLMMAQAKDGSPTGDVIKARRFVLENENGVPRAELFFKDDGTPERRMTHGAFNSRVNRLRKRNTTASSIQPTCGRPSADAHSTPTIT